MLLVWTPSPRSRKSMLVFHVTVTPMLIYNSYLTLLVEEPYVFRQNSETKMANSHFVKT